MQRHQNIRAGLSLALLAGLFASPAAVHAAEALSNSGMSDNFVTETAPAATTCKPSASPSTGPTSTDHTPCPVVSNNTAVINPAQDAVVNQTLAQDSPHSVPIDNNTPLSSAQALQNIENAIYGSATPTPAGGISYTSSGLGQAGGQGAGRNR